MIKQIVVERKAAIVNGSLCIFVVGSNYPDYRPISLATSPWVQSNIQSSIE